MVTFIIILFLLHFYQLYSKVAVRNVVKRTNIVIYVVWKDYFTTYFYHKNNNKNNKAGNKDIMKFIIVMIVSTTKEYSQFIIHILIFYHNNTSNCLIYCKICPWLAELSI